MDKKFFEQEEQDAEIKEETAVQPKSTRTTRTSKHESKEKEPMIEIGDKQLPFPEIASQKIESGYELVNVYENVTTQNQPRFAMGDMVLIFRKK